MRIYVSTEPKDRPVPLRRVAQFLRALDTMHAGVRFSLDADYGYRELNALFGGEPHGMFGWATPFAPLQFYRQSVYRTLQHEGAILLGRESGDKVGARGLADLEQDLVMSILLRDWHDADAFALRSIRAGSLETQAVLRRDLATVSRAIGTLVRGIGSLLHGRRGEDQPPPPDAERRRVARAVVRDAIPEAPRLGESPTGNASLGLVAVGVEQGLGALEGLGATGLDVDDEGSDFS